MTSLLNFEKNMDWNFSIRFHFFVKGRSVKAVRLCANIARARWSIRQKSKFESIDRQWNRESAHDGAQHRGYNKFTLDTRPCRERIRDIHIYLWGMYATLLIFSTLTPPPRYSSAPPFSFSRDSTDEQSGPSRQKSKMRDDQFHGRGPWFKYEISEWWGGFLHVEVIKINK